MASITDLDFSYNPNLRTTGSKEGRKEKYLRLNEDVLTRFESGYFTTSERVLTEVIMSQCISPIAYTYANKDHKAFLCFASNATLAKRCNISQKQAYTVRNQLIAKQVIVQLPPPDDWHYKHNPKPFDFLRGKLSLPPMVRIDNIDSPEYRKKKAKLKKEYGKPIGEVLLELLNQGHSQQSIAELWGVGLETINHQIATGEWLRYRQAINQGLLSMGLRAYREDTILLTMLQPDYWHKKPMYEPCPPPVKKQPLNE